MYYNPNNRQDINPQQATGPLADLESQGNDDHIFPENLRDYDHFMTFQPMAYRRENRNKAAKFTRKGIICLPVPANLQVSYQMNYTSTELGIAGAAAADAAAEATSGNIDFSSLAKIGGIVAVNSAKAAVQSLVSALIPDGVEQGVQIGAGKAVNPHLAMLFQGPALRTHNFQFRFIAESERDSIRIRNIIQKFKSAMHPQLQDFLGYTGAYFDYPDEWLISIVTGRKTESQRQQGNTNYLHRFKDCVLSGFNVNYNNQGIPLFFEDTGAPVDITIDLAFNETSIVTRKDIEEGY